MWGPYNDGGEARSCLDAYAQAIYGHPVGLIWTSNNQSAWLRPPVFDGGGNGLSLMVRCTQAPPPPPIQLPTLKRIEGALVDAGHFVQKYGPTATELALGLPLGTLRFFNEHVVAPVDQFLNAHPLVKEGIIVVADVVGVVAGVAAAITLATVGGTVAVVVGLAATVVAGGACLFLLVEDARHAWYVARGNEAARVALENTAHYQWIQAIAPWFTLPDLALGGRAVVREAVEATKVAGTAAPRIARYTREAEQARRELRVTIAEDNTVQAIHAAALKAQRRAAELQRMQAAANKSMRNMLVKQNAVAATAGTIWAARQYAHEPPRLVEHALGGGGEQEHANVHPAHHEAARRLGGQLAHPASPAHLLTPRRPAPRGAHSHLQITPVVTKRRANRR